MYSTYLRWHEPGKPMEAQTRSSDPAVALAAYRALLARRDLDGEPRGAVLRDQLRQKTLLFSRFDKPSQRMLPGDPVDLDTLSGNADHDTIAIVAARLAADGGETLRTMLKDYRAQLGVSQEGLARRWGVSTSWVTKAEQGGKVAHQGALMDLLGGALNPATGEA